MPMMGPGRLLFFITVTGMVHCAKESLEIIPSNGDVQLGEQTNFLCKVSGGGEATLAWIDPDDNEVSEDPGPYREKPIDELSKWLEVKFSDPSQGGLFQCQGTFDSGKIATAQIKIRVVQRPTFLTALDPEKEVIEGTRVVFNCQATGIPPPAVRWLFGNQDLGQHGDGRISVDGGTLVIEKTQPSDAGVYYCEAGIAERNEVAFTNVTFSVKFAPRITFPTSDLFRTFGIGKPNQFNFTILANPIPSVSVSWKGKIFEGNDIMEVAQDQNTYMFSFEFMPTSPEDISELQIMAWNELGSGEKNITLTDETPSKGMGLGGILAIVLTILLVLLLVVDVSCYYKRHRGLLMCCRVSVLGKEPPRSRVENSGKVLSKSTQSTVVNVSGIET